MQLSSVITLLFAFLPLLCYAKTPAATEESSNHCHKTKVLIVGAGVAGITAAQRLHQKGIDDFVIVEYTDEIGGRNRHTKFGEKPDGTPYTVELGSNWVQEINDNNPIWLLMKKYNIKHHISAYNSYLTYNETGRTNFSLVSHEFNKAQRRVARSAHQFVEKNLLDQSERAALTQAGWMPQWDAAAQAIEWFTYDFENGARTEDTSLIFGYSEKIPHDNTPGHHDTVPDLYVDDQRGFNVFVRGEANTFLSRNDPRLLLLTPVTRILYSSAGVTVHTSNASHPCIQASHAILTVSLGVLQASLSEQNIEGAIKFEPSLPSWKRRAIASFGMAIYTKIFMQFPSSQIFWPKEKQFFLWADPTIRGNYPIWQSLTGSGFLPGSGIIFPTATNPNSAQVEAQSDEVTKQQCLKILRKMFGAKEVPEPTAFMYPRWGQEPWARGSYSYWPTGVTLQEHENLRGTLAGRLWFAGEATSSENYGYLHGAWFEGRAAADDIVDCLERRGGNCTGQRHYQPLQGTNGVKQFRKANGFKIDVLNNKEKEELSGGKE